MEKEKKWRRRWEKSVRDTHYFPVIYTEDVVSAKMQVYDASV